MLSVNRKYEQSVTTDERRTFTKVLGADRENMHRDQTLGNPQIECNFVKTEWEKEIYPVDYCARLTVWMLRMCIKVQLYL